MKKDPVYEARDAAAKEIFEDMRRDRRLLPPKLRPLITYLLSHLFDLQLTTTGVWQGAGIRDHGQREAFRHATRKTLDRYVEWRRLQVADKVLLEHDGLDIMPVSMAVGYENHATFNAAYKRWLKETSSKARAKPRPREIDYLTYRRGMRGELDEDAARKVHDRWLEIYPALAREPRMELGGERLEGLVAGGLWLEIRHLPFDEQCRGVWGIRFRTTALFDLLLAKSREHGRRDRRRGIELAELALVSLDGSEEVFGERIHDLRAKGWAWLGNAHVLDFDFSAADAAFEKADAAWKVPRRQKDQLVRARVCNLEGTFRMFQRRYGDALALVERSAALFQDAGDPHGEARALIQAAAIHGYSDQLQDAVAALREARSLIDAEQEPYLAFAAATNLANVFARIGKVRAATASLTEAKEHCRRLDHPLGWCEIDWMAGHISEDRGNLAAAEKLYLDVQNGFREAGQKNCVALLDLDLAVVYARRTDPERALRHAAAAVPALAALELHEETVAVVSLLATALRSATPQEGLLRKVRESLRQDPLAGLARAEGRTQRPALENRASLRG